MEGEFRLPVRTVFRVGQSDEPIDEAGRPVHFESLGAGPFNPESTARRGVLQRLGGRAEIARTHAGEDMRQRGGREGALRPVRLNRSLCFDGEQASTMMAGIMSISESSRWCPSCEDYVLARSVGPNHLVHALVTLFLCGLWLPVWIIVCLTIDDRSRCTRCGLATDLIDEPEREPKKRKVRVMAEAEPIETAKIPCPTCGAKVEYWPSMMGGAKPCPACGELVRLPG